MLSTRTLTLYAVAAFLAVTIEPHIAALASPHAGRAGNSRGVAETRGPSLTTATPSSNLPLSFEPNQGQADPAVKWLSRGRGFTLFLTSTEAVISVRQDTGRPPLILRMQPVGSNPAPRVTGELPQPSEANYIRGNGGHASAIGIPTYGRVRYEDVYPDIDLVYYGSDHELEYDFVVAPGRDPDRIRLAFTGAEKLTVNAAGELVVQTAAGDLRQPKPIVYQEIDGARRAISGSYFLAANHQIGFRVGAYDRTRPLVIDPILAYSTYLGGRGNEVGWDTVVDSAKNVYITGTRPSVWSPDSQDFDAFVAKFNPAGALVWVTDVGDSCDDESRSIALDRAANVYITGQMGNCYPYPQLAPGAFVASLNTHGGGRYMLALDDSFSVGQAVAVDQAGNAYVAGNTSSSSFRTTAGAFQSQYAGGVGDGFVVKVNATGTAIVYASYLGGTGYESFNDIAVDGLGKVYVTGSTESWDFPTRNAYQGQHPGWGPVDLAGFVSKFTANGSALEYSTYLGGGPNTIALGIAVDSSGHAYVTGVTDSTEFPTTAGAVQPQPGDDRWCYYRWCTDAFVTKMHPSGSTVVYSTYLGGNLFDQGSGIAVDPAGNAYVTGNTSSVTFPTVQAFQRSLAGETDAFVAKLNVGGSALVYSSYLGGSRTSDAPLDGSEGGIRIAVDGDGTAYVVGLTYSSNFPVAFAYQPTFGGGTCAYVDRCADAFLTKIGERCVGPLCQPSGGGGPGEGGGATPPLTTTLNQTSFAPGEPLLLSASLTPVVTTAVDAYIVIDVPGMGPLSLQLDGSVLPGTVPIASGFVPFQFAGPIFQHTFNGGEPAGSYEIRAWLTETGTANVIGSVHVSSLTFRP